MKTLMKTTEKNILDKDIMEKKAAKKEQGGIKRASGTKASTKQKSSALGKERGKDYILKNREKQTQIFRDIAEKEDSSYYEEIDFDSKLTNKYSDFDTDQDMDFDEEDLDDIETPETSEMVDYEEETKVSSKASQDDDAIRYYLDEVSKHRLLTANEEKELSKKIQQGDEAALNKLINANLRLVVKIAKHYMSPDYALVDVIQDGNLGLIKAAKKFDFRKNVRFSTYASWWIKQTIVRSLSMRRRMIRIPHRKEEKLRKIKKAYSDYYQKYKATPSYSDLSEIIGIPTREIEEILNVSNPVVSYEYNINEDNCSIKNLISDDSYRPEDVLLQKILKKETEKLLSTLYPKERIILSYRFGFNTDRKKYTLKKMGKYFGISAETVRQIEIKALKKLKENYGHLSEYLN